MVKKLFESSTSMTRVDKRPLGPVIFFLSTLACQAIAAGCAILAWKISFSVTVTLLMAAATAWAAARFLRLPTPWLILNALLPFGAASALATEIPPGIFLAVFVALAATYVPAFWTRVPYYPTQRAAYALILAELPVDRPFTFIDLGCGFGELLRFLQARRPNGTFVGIEIGPLPFLVAKVRSLAHRSISVRFQSMWSCNLSHFDIVYTFLSPAPMERLWKKARAEMKAGSTLISNSFPAPAEASETLALRDARDSSLFIYRMNTGAASHPPRRAQAD